MNKICGIVLCALSVGTAQSATINWGTVGDVATVSDVITNETLVEAFNAGANGVADQTVNGVLFTGTGSLLPSDTGTDGFSGDTGNASYNVLLSNIDYGGGIDETISVGGGNLAAGRSYLIQVWYVDTRYIRDQYFGDGDADQSNDVQLNSKPGQYAIGTFTADGTGYQDLEIRSGNSNHGNVHITAYQIRTASSGPEPTLSTATNRVSAPFVVNVEFSEAITGLEESDFAVGNGAVAASSLSGSGNAFSVEIAPAANGNITVELPAGSVTDMDGDNTNPASGALSVFYIAPGGDQPSVVLSTASTNVIGAFAVDVVFDEPVTGLALDDFVVENGTVSNLTGSGSAYTVLVIPDVEDLVSVSLPEGVVIDLDGDGLWNTASEILAVTSRPLDVPSVTLYGNLGTDDSEYSLYVSFSEAVSGLTADDFVVVNGEVTSIRSQGRSYSLSGYYYSSNAQYYAVNITVASPGTVEVTLPAGAVVDADGDSLTNTVSNTLSFECAGDFGEQWVVDGGEEWAVAALSNLNLTLADGYAEPTANTARFTSIIKAFPVKKKARTVTFQQSPVWENWTASSGNLGPSDAGDAPVFVPAGDNDYYFLGLGNTGGYHAWHSTDMVTWIHKGPVTAPVTGRWVTSAEYKDGLYYIYSDYKNDHTPHLFIDDDLSDGVPGTYMGAAFPRATGEHGSDCSLIRNDDDGLFHLIYEDWSPIKARTHSWDSPLAGHTSSADGITGFVEGEHQPPIDERTTPTGTFGSYDHPNSPNIIYEIHTPEQDAYGDWTSIKIGSRFFMFCDFHPAGQGIRMARWSSDSIYEEFKFTGEMHDGHPDPSVGFAEGKFHLFTQQDTDYSSPGPWVEGVQARAGVDIDGNGSIDQWTAWQTISEQYDYTPGFIRVVTLTPAGLDLSGLPAGYGFQFEFSVDNTVVSGISPIMDSVRMEFEPSNFQQWANTNGIPAEMGEDNNTNGMPDVVEFAIGQTVVPERQPDGSLTVTAVNEAIDDGLKVELWFADDLLDSWHVAETNTAGVKLLSDVVDGEGNHELVFEVFDRNGTHIFWKLVVVSPE